MPQDLVEKLKSFEWTKRDLFNALLELEKKMTRAEMRRFMDTGKCEVLERFSKGEHFILGFVDTIVAVMERQLGRSLSPKELTTWIGFLPEYEWSEDGYYEILQRDLRKWRTENAVVDGALFP